MNPFFDDHDNEPCVEFTGEFNYSSAEKFRKDLRRAEEQAMSCGQPILPVTITSPGGSVTALIAMLEACEACMLPIATIATGEVSSAGAIFTSLAGADNLRYMGPYTTMMLHGVSTWMGGKLSDIESAFAQTAREEELIYSLMDKKCSQKEGFFQKKFKKLGNVDWYLTPEKAKKLKLIDHIGIPRLKTSQQYQFGFVKEVKEEVDDND